MAGTAVGDTKATASMRATPAATSASISRTRSATATGASGCSPSRGPTSRMTTDAGSAGNEGTAKRPACR